MVRRQLSDEDRLNAARAGDRDALGSLLHDHYDRVFLICLRMLHDRGAAEDCAQEAMIRIARGITGFDGRSSLSTWCHRIAVTTALDAIRHARRRPGLVRSRDDETDHDTSDPNAHTDVTDGVEGSETRAVIATALSTIPAEFARAVVMRDVADLDYAEIADLEGIAVGTVKSRISRGRALLNDALSGNRETGNRRPTSSGSDADPT